MDQRVIEIDSHRIESADGTRWAVRRDTISRNRKHYNTMWSVKTRVAGKATTIANVSTRAFAESIITNEVQS